MNLTITERVTNGMAYLDERYPDHVDRVDIARLDVGSSLACPLGQADGESYEKGILDAVVELDDEREWSRDHGFSWIRGDNFLIDIVRLTNEWKRQYQARRNATSE